MSQRCQKRHQHSYSITSSALSTINGGTERPSAFAVLRLTTNWQLNGKLRWFCTAENAIHIAGRATKYISKVSSVGKQTAVSGDNRCLVDRRHIVARRQDRK